MKKHTIIIILLITIIFVGTYSFYINTIDTFYAKKYSDIFGSYDIKKVDRFLDSNTEITYKGETKKYKELRENVLSAFKAREYEMPDESSYGNGNNRFVNGIQKIDVQVSIISGQYSDHRLKMEIERTGLLNMRIKSLESNDEFFGYLFFGY